MASTKIRVVCISDTHNHRPGEGFTLPKGDVLIHAGDLTNNGSVNEVKKAIEWLSAVDHPVKIVVAGNHDICLDPNFARENVERDTASIEQCRKGFDADSRIHYLQHEGAVIPVPGKNVSLSVFGSPYSPSRGQHAWGFQYDEDASKDIWKAIPDKIDILVTHTPPMGYCDTSQHWQQGGCEALLSSVSKARPLLHVCGHCHEGRGAVVVDWNDGSISRMWEHPGVSGKKQSLLDLTGVGRSATHQALRAGTETAIVNASIMMHSHSSGQRKEFNKPMVVDLLINQNSVPEGC